MANQLRGQTPFRALGREMWIAYRAQELAAMQSALGFGRLDPVASPEVERVPALNLRANPGTGALEHVADADGKHLAAIDDNGQVRMRHVIVDHRERRRRQIEAFDAALLSPSAGELLTMVRIGLRPFEAVSGPLLDGQWDEIVVELGLGGLQALHGQAVANSYEAMLPENAGQSGGGDPNAQSPGEASRT